MSDLETTQEGVSDKMLDVCCTFMQARNPEGSFFVVCATLTSVLRGQQPEGADFGLHM